MKYHQRLQERAAEQRLQLARDAMGASPPGCKRLKLRERIRLSPAQLAARTRPLLSLGAEYAARVTFMNARDERPTYKARLWRLTGHLFTVQARIDLRKFPSVALCGADVAAYVAEFERLNHLSPRWRS